MNRKNTRRNAPLTFLFALALLLSLPIISYAQGRGNGRGAGANIDKKCAKFVNCHDARDGRWDGRGPAVNPVTNAPVIQTPAQPNVPIYRNRRHRNSDQDNQVLYPQSRHRRTTRNSDT